jgi:hypothetical protein
VKRRGVEGPIRAPKKHRRSDAFLRAQSGNTKNYSEITNNQAVIILFAYFTETLLKRFFPFVAFFGGLFH